MKIIPINEMKFKNHPISLIDNSLIDTIELRNKLI